MRIGIFTETYEPFISGIVTSIKMLKNSLERMGHEVFIVTANLEDMHHSYDEDKRILKIPGVPLKKLYDIRLTGIYSLKALTQIKKWKLDVIHLQTEWGVGIFGRLIAKQYNIPLVYTYHTMYEDYAKYITKGLFDNTSRKIVKYLTRAVCDKDVKAIITPTKKSRDLLKKKYQIENNVYTIPNGIEIERFYREKFSQNIINAYKKDLGISKDDFVLFYLGRVAKEKNIALLIEAMPELVKTNQKLKLLIVGYGPEAKKLEKQANKLKVGKYVIFVGKVTQDIAPFYYQLGDLFVIASQTETQGMTVIEAMAASMPVVCIEDVCYKKMVSDKVNGRYFKDKKEYISIVKELVCSPKELEKYGIESRKKVEPYSAKYFGEKVFAIYKKVIKSSKGTRFPILKKITGAFKKRG